ncbi:MAG: hypothetical protein AAGB14_09235, partial [Verrucomicrobiota bacterium]
GSVVDHHNPRNISHGGVVRRKWQKGVRDYAAGYDTLFEVVKCASRITEPPFLVGSAAWLTGYMMTALKRPTRMVPPDVVEFFRKEQRDRLKRWVGIKREAPASAAPQT